MDSSLIPILTRTEVWIGGLGLAAFLALFWVLRGASPGQSVAPERDVEAPHAGYRDRVIASVCIGMLLILLGAYLGMTRGVRWSILPFALGFGTVFALILINQRYRHGSPTLRRAVDLSTATLNAALLAGVLIVVNVLVFRYGGAAIDLTREGSYTLSSQSINQVRTLQRPVRFVTFFGRSPTAYLEFDRIRQLLELYQAANPDQVRLEHIDPFREPTRFEELTRRVPGVDLAQGGGVVVEYGDDKSRESLLIRNSDLFEIPRVSRFNPDVDRLETIFKGEDAVTTALARLREAKKPLYVFTTGHGEPSIDETGTDRPSAFGIFRSRLASTGAEVTAVNTLTQDIPDDAALIVIAGAKTPFQPDEVSKLRAYADHKKPLLVLVSDSDSTGLNGLLESFDIEMGRGVVIEPRANVRGRAEIIVTRVLEGRHPVVEPLENQYLIFPRATPLKIRPPDPGRPPAPTVAVSLLKSTAQSWAEPDLRAVQASPSPEKEKGPFVLALAVSDRVPAGESTAGLPRLVVFGCRYLADNGTVIPYPANLDLLMNSVSWLCARPELSGLSPKTQVALTLTADPALRARLILVPTVMAILLIISLGVVTYLTRRD